MTPIPDFLKCLFSTFDQSAVQDFRAFLALNPGVTKWQLAADFCLHDKDRPNDVFAFTLIPYDDYLENLNSEISKAIPKDIKKTSDIKEECLAFLRDTRRYHFGFIMKGSPKYFYNGEGSNSLAIARESLDLMLKQLVDNGRSKDNIKKLKMLIQSAKAKNFNVELFGDMLMLINLFCFITLVLARERQVEVLGWFPDRDSMTTWCDGVIWDISYETLGGLSEYFNIPLPFSKPTIAVPNLDDEVNSMWFDEFVRLPDYMAGILSAWDLENNKLPDDKPKFIQLAEEVLSKASNIAVIKIRYDDLIECSRITFSPKTNETAAT